MENLWTEGLRMINDFGHHICVRNLVCKKHYSYINMSNINQKIKEEATSVLTRVLLFLLYYVGLIVLGICLFVVAGWITIQISGILSDLEYINIRLLISRSWHFWPCGISA